MVYASLSEMLSNDPYPNEVVDFFNELTIHTRKLFVAMNFKWGATVPEADEIFLRWMQIAHHAVESLNNGDKTYSRINGGRLSIEARRPDAGVDLVSFSAFIEYIIPTS